MKNKLHDLKISVYSFGYQKSGIPENEFGDGGGFVFDCRFLPNPFHDLALRDFTGLDKQIISFFSEYRSVRSFIEECAKMVENAAESYLERGFCNIQVSFGCTGGRHRSVYCAEEFVKIMTAKGYCLTLEHTEL